jgi:hypothetical protein
LDSRENPSFTNSGHTVSALIGCPICVKVAASFSTFRHPEQRPHGIAQRRGLNEALERGDEPRSFSQTERRPPLAAANPPLRQRLRINIPLAAIDRRAGEPCDLRDDRETASTSCPHLRCREQVPPSLVDLRADCVPSQPNGGLVDHATDLPLFAETGTHKT